MDKANFIRQLRSNGVVGAGGAGFPTYKKVESKVRTVIVNAAECEPLLHKDKELLKHYPEQILQGLVQVMEATEAEEGIIGIKEKYGEVIKFLSQHLPTRVRIFPLRDFYPAGDEFTLVYEVTGQVIQPGCLPLSVGVMVLNVESLLNVFLQTPVVEKYLTIGGAVKDPVTVKVPLGCTIAEALALAGGPTVDKYAFLIGGIMMAKYQTDPQMPITKTTGGIIVIPEDHPILKFFRRDCKAVNAIGRAACDQCCYCTELCPRYLLGHPIEPHKAMRTLGFSMRDQDPYTVGTLYCCECNLCSFIACPEDLDPRNVCVQAKQVAREKGLKWQSDKPVGPHPLINDRRPPVKRLMTKLGLNQFHNVGPLIDRTVEPRQVVLPLRQHVGAPAQPVVKVGDRVTVGQMIANVPEDQLGVPLHASIAGTVTGVDGAITIVR